MRLAATDCGCVAAGAAGGALLRYGVSEWGKGKGQGPAAILLINVVGSFVLGGCTGALPGTRAALLVGTGFCGSFTTFSTYSVDGAARTNSQNATRSFLMLAHASSCAFVSPACAYSDPDGTGEPALRGGTIRRGNKRALHRRGSGRAPTWRLAGGRSHNGTIAGCTSSAAIGTHLAEVAAATMM